MLISIAVMLRSVKIIRAFRLRKIAGGPNSDDYNWTDVLMRKVPLNMMWGISLHHYTIPKTWSDKGSATQFDEKEYFATMRKYIEDG